MTENRIIVAHHSRFDYAFAKNFRGWATISADSNSAPNGSAANCSDFGSSQLSHLCKKLNIPLNGAHRALADANATLQLFQHLQILEKCPVSETESLKENIRENILPPGLNRNDINKLAEGCGVYFFYDERDRLIYVGKSKNIRKRVQSHFSGDLKSQKSLKMKHHIRRIDYQITGSELIALLLESDLIKTHQPVFNRSQRTIRYRYGLFSQLSADGYLTFSLQRFEFERTKRYRQGTGDCLLQQKAGAIFSGSDYNQIPAVPKIVRVV
ncbi:MAG: GIY-YIG nuclease family protein [Calditrichia bacterium]